MKINRQNLKLKPLRLMAGAGLIMASFLSEATALFDCTKCNIFTKKCATNEDNYFTKCDQSCPIKKGKDPIQRCREAHAKATLPEVHPVLKIMKTSCEDRQKLIELDKIVMEESADSTRRPYSEKEKEFILTGCPASTPTPEKRPLSLQEEALQKRENLKKTGSPDTPPSEKVTPSPIPPRLKSASPTHVTQQAAAKGSAEDLKEQLKRSDFTMLGSLSKGKTPDQILDIIKQKPELFTEKEKVVKYLEKLKEEEGATPPDYAPPLPPSSVETAPPPKHGVVSLPPPLRVPPQNNAPQNVQ